MLPLAVAALTAVALLLLLDDATGSPWALALFVFAAFALTGLGQEFWNGAAGQHRLIGESMPAALVAVVSRNRRRYGGYIVHIGVIVLLIGIAASSSFQTKRDVTLRPGEGTVVDERTVTYVKPTVEVTEGYLQFGTVVRVAEDGEPAAVVRPSRRYFRPTGQESGTIASFFDGEATSEIGLQAGLLKDFWVAGQPNLTDVRRRVRTADDAFTACIRAAPGAPPQCASLAA